MPKGQSLNNFDRTQGMWTPAVNPPAPIGQQALTVPGFAVSLEAADLPGLRSKFGLSLVVELHVRAVNLKWIAFTSTP